jgi:hypothetical protein
MVVRIRWHRVPRPHSFRSRNLALAAASLLAPSALLAFTIAAWTFASDMRWTKNFFPPDGLFSHWQVWLIAAAVLLLVSRLLDRYASRPEEYF